MKYKLLEQFEEKFAKLQKKIKREREFFYFSKELCQEKFIEYSLEIYKDLKDNNFFDLVEMKYTWINEDFSLIYTFKIYELGVKRSKTKKQFVLSYTELQDFSLQDHDKEMINNEEYEIMAKEMINANESFHAFIKIRDVMPSFSSMISLDDKESLSGVKELYQVTLMKDYALKISSMESLSIKELEVENNMQLFDFSIKDLELKYEYSENCESIDIEDEKFGKIEYLVDSENERIIQRQIMNDNTVKVKTFGEDENSPMWFFQNTVQTIQNINMICHYIVLRDNKIINMFDLCKLVLFSKEVGQKLNLIDLIVDYDKIEELYDYYKLTKY